MERYKVILALALLVGVTTCAIAEDTCTTPANLVFGSVPVGSTSSPKNLRITRAGEERISGTVTSSSSAFFILNPSYDIVPPTPWADIKITFTPTHCGDHQATITVPCRTLGVSATGRGTNCGVTAPGLMNGILDFGVHPPNGGEFRQVTVANLCTGDEDPFRFQAQVTGVGFFTAPTGLVSLGPGETYTFTVSFKVPADQQRCEVTYTGTLWLTGFGEECDDVALVGKGKIEPSVIQETTWWGG